MKREQIHVEENYSGLPGLLKDEKSVFLVYDRNVAYLAEEISSRISPKASMRIEACEQTKNMDSVLGICSFLQEHEADRGALLLALGGGVTTDMTGFAASIYKRGIRFATLPTTLLAMVDAAVGGKTGVNFKNLKNTLGTFQEPEFVYVNTSCLSTLSHKQFLSGAAELLKTFLISDAALYEKALSELQTGKLTKESILEAIEIKRGITGRDFRESGERRLLNLGHTVGHAIEFCQQKEITPSGAKECGTTPDAEEHDGALSHGEAVAVGIICISHISEKCGIGQKGLEKRLTEDFVSIGLPVKCPYGYDELLNAIRQDKKAVDGKLHCVLLREPGTAVQHELSAEETVSILKA